MPDRRADAAFFAVEAVPLARRLLGSVLVRCTGDGHRLSGRIVEVEAYLGAEDRGSHARGGLRSARNESMYARGGTLYVYFTYGMHHCLNLVSGEAGSPQAVLIRALEPLEGLDSMEANRRKSRRVELCSGPAKLCQALDVSLAMNGLDLVSSRTLWVEPAAEPTRTVRSGPRIGLGCDDPWRSKPLRFWVADSPWLSR